MTTIAEILNTLADNGLELTIKLSPNRKPTEDEMGVIEKHAQDIKRFFLLQSGELITHCRNQEFKQEGAQYCRHCWRYQFNACFPDGRTLVKVGDKLVNSEGAD